MTGKWCALTGSNRRHSPCKGGPESGTVSISKWRECKCLISGEFVTGWGRPLQVSSPEEHGESLVRSRETPAKVPVCFLRDSYRRRDALTIVPYDVRT